MKRFLEVSIIIPTLNSERTLEKCLKAIREQKYPQENIEIIVADGGSIDNTLKIAKKYNCNIVSNKLETGEAGKAVGLKKASKEIVCFIDSDNILPNRIWLQEMTFPFRDNEIAGTEPLYYTWRKEDGYINRYCALMGMNDPLCFFLRNYDRYNYITKKWTEMPVKEMDKGKYIKIILNKKHLPTIGANGFLIRKKILKECPIKEYLFDIDVVYKLSLKGINKYAKVKIGVIHLFCKNIKTFTRKQRRRIRDFLYYQSLNTREYPWEKTNKIRIIKFILCTLLILPLFFQAIRGYLHKKDGAWFFHPLACVITLFVYTQEAFLSAVKIKKVNRKNWSQ